MTYILTKIQWELYHLLKRNLLGIPFAPILLVFSGAITIGINYIFWIRWKKEVKILTGFYIALYIGLLLSQPFYLGFISLTKGLDSAIRAFFGGTTIPEWGSGFFLSFLYLFLFHRKKLPDTCDHIVPFFSLFYGFLNIIFFGLGWHYGKPTSLPFGVVFHPETRAGAMHPNLPLHPLQLDNLIGSLIIFPLSIYLLKRRRFEGEVSLWIIFYAGFMKTIERLFFIEGSGKPVLFPILSFLSISLILISYLITYWRRKRIPSFK